MPESDEKAFLSLGDSTDSSLDVITSKLEPNDPEYLLSTFQLEEQVILSTDTPLKNGSLYKVKAQSLGTILDCYHNPLKTESATEQNQLKYTVSFFVPPKNAMDHQLEWGFYLLLIPEKNLLVFLKLTNIPRFTRDLYFIT